MIEDYLDTFKTPLARGRAKKVLTKTEIDYHIFLKAANYVTF